MQPYLAYFISFVTIMVVMFLPNTVMKTSIPSAWYACIRPDMTPPNYVFPIVWTILYITIGIGLAETLLLKSTYEQKILLGLYAWNLFLNVLWSFVYFGKRDVVMALFVIIHIIVSTVFILYYTYLILPVWIVWMLLPYLAWLLFAAFLNFLSTWKKCA